MKTIKGPVNIYWWERRQSECRGCGAVMELEKSDRENLLTVSGGTIMIAPCPHCNSSLMFKK